MKSRIYRYFVTASILAFAISGCNSLEQGPTNKFTDDNFWESADRAMLMVNMGYRQMFEAKWLYEDEVLSDNMIEMRGNPDSRVIRQSQATPSLGLFKSRWEDIFKGIKTTNVFLDKVELVPDMLEDRRIRLESEMRFIRAWIFFRISNLWGDIPFFLRDITLEESYSVTRTPRAQVLAELHRELDEIIPLLPTRNQLPATENGRITKGAAVMLKAKMYMYERDYVNAERYLEMLIEDQATYGTYALFTDSWTDNAGQVYPPYEALFLSENEYNSEVILDCAFVPIEREWDELNTLVPQSLPDGMSGQFTTKTPTQSLVDSYLMADGRTITQAREDGDYRESNMYQNRDPRLDGTVVYNGYSWRYTNPTSGQSGSVTVNTFSEYEEGENFTRTGYYTRKLYDPSSRANYKQNNNLILMRYADALLLYAEAYHENHGMTEEVWNKTIRPIRERAGFTAALALDFPTLSETEMREVIRNERRVELALEGQRYWDIMRWNEGSNLLNGIVYGAFFYNGRTEYIPVANNKFLERDKLWAIPQMEIDNVPTLRPNNNGY